MAGEAIYHFRHGRTSEPLVFRIYLGLRLRQLRQFIVDEVREYRNERLKEIGIGTGFERAPALWALGEGDGLSGIGG
jgi:hypothetical protein